MKVDFILKTIWKLFENLQSNKSLVQSTARAIKRPCSIYQYYNMAPRLSGQTSSFGAVFFVPKTFWRIERNFTILTRKARSDVRILINRTWPMIRCIRPRESLVTTLPCHKYQHKLYPSPFDVTLTKYKNLKTPRDALNINVCRFIRNI